MAVFPDDIEYLIRRLTAAFGKSIKDTSLMSILQITESSLRKAACKLNKPQTRYEFFAQINYRIKTAF
jgi:ABC-type amino acid transport system permease subunit